MARENVMAIESSVEANENMLRPGYKWATQGKGDTERKKLKWDLMSSFSDEKEELFYLLWHDDSNGWYIWKCPIQSSVSLKGESPSWVQVQIVLWFKATVYFFLQKTFFKM